MLEEALPAIWAWVTPTVLFVLINIFIGTIAFSSSLGSSSSQKENKKEGSDNTLNLVRTGSLLERLKSLNLYPLKSEESQSITALFDPEPPKTLQTLETTTHQAPITLHEKESFEDSHETHFELTVSDSFEDSHETHFERTVSDTRPTAGEMPEKLPEKLKKSASSKSAFAHFKEEEITGVRRPATTKVGKPQFGEDEEVDAKADDFINKFKQQLKLQRLDSLIRYKEMINRAK